MAVDIAIDTNRYRDFVDAVPEAVAVLASRGLRSAGTPIPTNDLWIAALVVQHDVMLYSRDTHFDALAQLPRLRRV